MRIRSDIHVHEHIMVLFCKRTWDCAADACSCTLLAVVGRTYREIGSAWRDDPLRRSPCPPAPDTCPTHWLECRLDHRSHRTPWADSAGTAWRGCTCARLKPAPPTQTLKLNYALWLYVYVNLHVYVKAFAAVEGLKAIAWELQYVFFCNQIVIIIISFWVIVEYTHI